MLNRNSLPRVLLMLSAFVFFSAGTLHLVENHDGAVIAQADNKYYFDFDYLIKKGPYLNLKSAILVNYDNGRVIYGKNIDKVRPVASLTKLVMAMVLIDSKLDLATRVKISRKDARRSSRSRLLIGYELTVKDLLFAAMLNSDNRAARAIARTVSGSYDEFVVLMNDKVKKLGLTKTHFVEPTGLDKLNVSTAHEMARLLHYAYDYELIATVTATKRYQVTILSHRNTIRQMANTNLMVHSPYKVLAGKTGYIRAADYCLATLVRNRKGERLTLVVLGVPGDKLRFRESRKLMDWGFKKLPLASL